MGDDKINLDELKSIAQGCALTVGGIERTYEFSPQQVRNWLNGKVRPNAKNKLKLDGVFKMLKEKPRIPYHPSWGYATPEQIEKKQQITPIERERIMKQIEKQTRLRGKVD